MNDIHHLERQLRTAEERQRCAAKALAPKHKGGEWEEYWAANREVLLLERQLAAAKGEEYAEPCDFPLKWDTERTDAAPDGETWTRRALLAFLLSEPNPAWDGSYVTVKDPGDEQAEGLALVEFDCCVSAKLGDPNDEVFEGHPLSGKGLEAYGAQRVVNSRWLKEIETINSVHRMYNPEMWCGLTHFIFWFHDNMFECIARSYKVETHRISMKELLVRMVNRLIS